jgi:hypothetical protein
MRRIIPLVAYLAIATLSIQAQIPAGSSARGVRIGVEKSDNRVSQIIAKSPDESH